MTARSLRGEVARLFRLGVALALALVVAAAGSQRVRAAEPPPPPSPSSKTAEKTTETTTEKMTEKAASSRGEPAMLEAKPGVHILKSGAMQPSQRAE